MSTTSVVATADSGAIKVPAPSTGVTGGKPLMTHSQIMLVIYGLMAGMFLGSLDQTIVGTAIRTIGDDLHGLDQQAWVTTAYMITSTIMTPIYGKLSDIFGRRALFLSAIGIFIVGSLASSFATSMMMLAVFRALQGIGAGGLMSLPLAILADVLAPRERAKYQGYFLAVFGVSSVVGPLVGGLFSGAEQILWIPGWRWVFLINVPFGIIALFMVFTFLRIPKVGHHAHSRIDWWGATFVVVTLLPLLLVAEQGRNWGWTSWQSMSCYIIGAVGLVAFILIERAMKDDAIIPMRLFNNQPFSMSTVLGIFVGFAMFGSMMTIPLYMQIVVGLNPTESGFATLPMVLGIMVSSITVGQIIAKTGKYGAFPVTGTLCMIGGFVMFTFITYNRPLWFIMIAMFIVGLGLGQLMQTLTMTAQNSVASKDIGVATSGSTFFRQIGGTLGTAVLLSVLFAAMPHNITAAMADKPTLTAALNAALDPAVAGAKHNAGIMKNMWNPILDEVKKNINKNLDEATKKVNDTVAEKVQAKVSQAVYSAGEKGNAKLADGATKLADGQSKLSTGVGKFATGASKYATGMGAFNSGLGKLKQGEHKAATSASAARANFTKLAKIMAVQGKCQKGNMSACAAAKASAGQLPGLMKKLGVSIGTTDIVLNGGTVKGKSFSGVDAGLSQVAAGGSKLSAGAQQLSSGASKLADGMGKVSQGSEKLAGGAAKLAGLSKFIDDKVDDILPDAQAKALKEVAKKQHLEVIDGKLRVNYADKVQREAIVKKIVPTMVKHLKDGDSKASSKSKADTSDTSFLKGADAVLTKPFMVGFSNSAVSIYLVGLGVLGLALITAVFMRVPPLRKRSGIEEAAETAKQNEDESVDTTPQTKDSEE